MKRLIIFIATLISLSSFGQARFVQQIDQSTHFGANLQGLSATDEIMVIKRTFQLKFIRSSAILSTYTSGVDNTVKRIADSGLRVILNVNWQGSGAGTGSKGFPTNMLSYRTKLNAYLSDNKQYLDGAVIVIENEPFNGNFFDYASGAATVEDYIVELSNAISLCHQYNIEVADGCTHLAAYKAIENAYPSLPSGTQASSAAVRDAIAMYAYDTMQLNYCNYHFDGNTGISNTDTSLTPDIIRDDMAFAYQVHGHRPMSNEWHQEDVGTASDWNKLCIDIVTQTRNAHSRYAIVFSGDGTHPALPFVDQTTLALTPLGQTYKDAVMSGQ